MPFSSSVAAWGAKRWSTFAKACSETSRRRPRPVWKPNVAVGGGGAGLVGCCSCELGAGDAVVVLVAADVVEEVGGGGTLALLSADEEVKQPEASNSFILASSSPHAS